MQLWRAGLQLALRTEPESENFRRAFPAQRRKRSWEELELPQNDRFSEEAVWFSQRMLLGSRRNIDDIADAVLKVCENRDRLVQAGRR